MRVGGSNIFKHLLVPLDGSRLAETILPVVRALARALDASVTLLHVVEPAAPPQVHGEPHLLNAPDAHAYLERIAPDLRGAQLRVDIHVDIAVGGNTVKAIFAHGGELKADLIALTSHGRGGLRQAVSGTIAQQVLQSGAIPVLWLRAEQPAASSYTCQRILVPLDSSPVYESALDTAIELARALRATISIVLVVPTMGTLSPERGATGLLLPSSTRAMLDLAEHGAAEYLAQKLKYAQSSGVNAEGRVPRGDIPTQIIFAEQQERADLIVMATHGRAGLDAFWSGSIAPRVMSRARAPVLLLRVTGEEPLR